MKSRSGFRPDIALPAGVALLMLLLLWAIGQEFLQGYALDLGRALNAPSPGFGRFLALWIFFGSLAAGALSLAVVRWLGSGDRFRRLQQGWNAGSERKWVLYSTAFAFLIPGALRTLVLHGAPLTDDASAYRLMAELIAGGRVYGDSPPLKLFFDNRFLINDGKLYSHYFVGWPALLAPGVWLGITGWMNALYSALTIPALWLTSRRLFGPGWARLATLIYLASPMLMIAAATGTAHTSCVMALFWTLWFWLRSREPGAPWWTHAGLATAFSIAFFIRPTSALGVGLPVLVVWLVQRFRERESRWRALLAFALPAIVFAALFLAVNRAQTGSYFEVAYQRAFSYAAENDFRFSLWPAEAAEEGFTEFNFSGPLRSLAVNGAAFFRFSLTFLGWPCSILFAFFASRRLHPGIGVLWASVATYFLTHALTDNVGIDTFAPMHYFELAVPFLLLNVAGLARLSDAGQRIDDLERQAGEASGWRRQTLPAALAGSLIVLTTLAYAPVRLGAIERIAQNVLMPWQALQEAGIERAVIFAPEPFIFYCRSSPTRGWVFVRPNNDPQLANDLLWVNHLTVEQDRALMRHFPDRPGYVMAWDRRCRVNFLPLDRLPEGAVPDAALPHFRHLDLPAGAR